MKKAAALLLCLCSLAMAKAQVFTNVINTKAALIFPALDGFGNLYTGGFFADSTQLGGAVIYGTGNNNDPLLVKWGAAGNVLWYKTGGTTGNEKFVFTRSDASGNVYGIINFSGTTTWEGNSYTSLGLDDYLVVKYSAGGVHQWTRHIGSTINDNGYYAFLDLDGAGNVHLCCMAAAASMSVDGTPYPIGSPGTRLVHVKLNGASGAVISVADFANTNTTFVGAFVLHVDENENIYGSFGVGTDALTIGGTALAAGHYHFKVNAAGTLAWANITDYYGSDRGESVAVDPAGNVVWTGDWDTHLSLGDTVADQTGGASNDMFVVRYDPSGNPLWVRLWGSTGSDEAPVCLRMADGNYMIGGLCGGTMNVGGLTLSPNGGDACWIKISPDGEVLSAQSTHAPGNEVVFDGEPMAIDALSNIVLTCGTMPPTNFGPFSFTDPQTQYFNLVIAGDACQASGKVFRDFNSDGVNDASDQGLPYAVVATNTGGYYAMSGSSGAYQLFTAPGTYTLSVPDPPLYHTLTTAATQSASFTALGQVDSLNNFGFYPTPGIRDMKISAVSTYPAKPGQIWSMMINCQNVGTDTANGSSALGLPAGLSYYYSSPAPSFSSADSLTWTFTNLLPGETRSQQVFLSLGSGATEGTVLDLPMTVISDASDQTPANNFYAFSTTVVSSYDPNYKDVTPSAVAPAYVQNGGWFDYAIHFQNTGSDTAFSIVIRDTLDANLDIASLEMTGASHPYSLSLKNPRVLEFLFSNILLPDSNVNEPASHGVIAFRMKAKADMQTPGIIPNTAAIYFDYNTPVITAPAIVTVGTLGAGEVGAQSGAFVVYPNPARSELHLSFSGLKAAAVLTLSDVSGRAVRTWNVGSAQQSLSLQGIAPGMYYARMTAGGKVIGVQKIVVQP